ncbi:rod shape-determining protein MreC [Aurantiacibacter aquimixticola]|uniref:Cell shape-determining protein MreC n=1 Tax=Aurantiacibacter aquimixticola TaxID=1958945 RepID=A0A419RRN4_9SPHN|nr:rod shape-determining protein MreC [Aurantiacibacter aquimixticola]RJY08437.1 rod shape-determining protein MreC [Aurantiacibacter aquimixticola]
MAPPSAQTSGSNKRAQFSRFTGYVLASLGAILGALLLIISLWRPEAFYGLRSMATDAASPVGEAGAVGRSGSRGFFEAIAGYYNAGSKNAELEQEIEIARVKLAEARALEQENARLKGVLGLLEGDVEPIATGRLIGSSSASTRRFGYLSAGRSDGVEVGMPVTSPMGLVGRVLEAGRSTSRVLLLTDPESIVPVRRATDDVVAFAEGRADGSLRIRLINLGINPLEEGDIFVTSGAGGLFRPGVAVAMVRETTDDGAIASLLSNPAATDFVVIEPIFEPEAIEAATQPLLTDRPVPGMDESEDEES